MGLFLGLGFIGVGGGVGGIMGCRVWRLLIVGQGQGLGLG